MSRTSRLAALALLAPALAALPACDRPSPTAPNAGSLPAPSAPPRHPTADSAASARAERLAAMVARALGDPAFRARLKQDLDASPFAERKLHFQRYLKADGRRALAELARANQVAPDRVESEADAARALELYLPVPAHRAAWPGDDRILVATAQADGEAPVAFDPRGGRRVLSPDAPPETPVLALVPVETNFDRAPGPSFQTCQPSETNDCGGGGGGAGTPSPTPGLYMSYSHVVDDFEGWFKGDPEYEIHIMGQAGATDSLVRYQCAGEHAGGAYAFDQNEPDWYGSVLLFSQAQLDAYRKQHPKQSVRIIMLEDDDTACVMKVDQDRWAELMAAVNPVYRDVTGALDTLTIAKILKAKTSLQKFLSALASWVNTSDELIGNAIEDRIVGEYRAGANWIVRGDNNVTNAWLKLEMR